jgi:hypothetical protein
MDRSSRWLEARLAAGDEGELVLAGWSMAPALRDGDRLRIAPYSAAARPAPGQIVVSRRAGRLVTHRLISLHAGQAITRGDGCQRDDPPVDASTLLGRVVEVRRGTRRLAPPERAHGIRKLVERFRGSAWS